MTNIILLMDIIIFLCSLLNTIVAFKENNVAKYFWLLATILYWIVVVVYSLEKLAIF